MPSPRAAPGGTLELLLPFVLNKVARNLNASLQDALRDRGLSIPEWRVLATLGWTDIRRPSEISSFTAIEPSTLTRTLDRLVAAGLITRAKLPERGRALQVLLTDDGARVLTNAREAVEAQQGTVFAALGPEDGQRFLDLLLKLYRAVGDADRPLPLTHAPAGRPRKGLTQ